LSRTLKEAGQVRQRSIPAASSIVGDKNRRAAKSRASAAGIPLDSLLLHSVCQAYIHGCQPTHAPSAPSLRSLTFHGAAAVTLFRDPARLADTGPVWNLSWMTGGTTGRWRDLTSIYGPLGCTRIAHGSGIRGGRVDMAGHATAPHGLRPVGPDIPVAPANETGSEQSSGGITPQMGGIAAHDIGPGSHLTADTGELDSLQPANQTGAFTCTQGMLLTSKKGGGAYEVTGDSRLSRSCRYMTHRNTGQGRPDMARRPSVNGWHRKPGRPVTQGPGCTGQGQGGTTHESRE